MFSPSTEILCRKTIKDYDIGSYVFTCNISSFFESKRTQKHYAAILPRTDVPTVSIFTISSKISKIFMDRKLKILGVAQTFVSARADKGTVKSIHSCDQFVFLLLKATHRDFRIVRRHKLRRREIIGKSYSK